MRAAQYLHFVGGKKYRITTIPTMIPGMSKDLASASMPITIRISKISGHI